MLQSSGVRERGGGSGCVGQEIVDLLSRLSFESKGNKGHGKFHGLMDEMLSRENYSGWRLGNWLRFKDNACVGG